MWTLICECQSRLLGADNSLLVTLAVMIAGTIRRCGNRFWEDIMGQSCIGGVMENEAIDHRN